MDLIVYATLDGRGILSVSKCATSSISRGCFRSSFPGIGVLRVYVSRLAKDQACSDFGPSLLCVCRFNRYDKELRWLEEGESE